MKRQSIIILLVILSITLRMFEDRRTLVELNVSLTPFKGAENTAIFAAYSADGSISDYVITYLKRLKEIAPNIIYITDNPIQKKELEKLRPYVNHVMAFRHGEYDWGSYKRGYNFLVANEMITPLPTEKKRKEFSADRPLLILANDSALPIAQSFKPITDKMTESGADFWGITANQDGTYHLQSYFLAFTPVVYRSEQFGEYLNEVKQEADGLNVAYRYEVPLTSYLEELGFKSASYLPYEEMSALPLNDKNCYPLTLLSQWHAPFLKMRTFTDRLTVQEPRRLVFEWLKKNAPQAYKELIAHLKKIKSPYLKDNR